MCGIAGLIGLAPVNEQAVAEMAQLMAHRGPDDFGLWTSGNGRAVFGHRRLSVIDPTPAGHQPMVRGSNVITFNGEIYNYVELAERLTQEGIQFNSTSDTEVLLAAYATWGEDCVKELNGMFAFAIHDAGRQIVFCARDRYGEKPFLFHSAPDHFAFASEYKALLSLQTVGAEYDQVRLLRFLHRPSQGLDGDEQTVFSDIRQLLPAHSLTIDLNNLRWKTKRYWDVSPTPELARLSEEDAQREFGDLLRDSVRIRMRSDVGQGSCLSGGLDSTAIVVLARELLGPGASYDTFTGTFPGTDADEEKWARIASEALSTNAHYVSPGPHEFLEELPDFIWHNELPVGSASQYAQWCVFRRAKEAGVTVLLDGQGADELLGGYEQYFEKYLLSFPANADGIDIADERNKILHRYPLALPTNLQNLKRSLPRPLSRLAGTVLNRGSDFSFGLSADFARKMHASLPPPPEGAAGFNPLAATLYEESLHTLLPVLLRYGDRNSMAHSREVRLPFCDHRLAEFVLSLRPELLMGGAQTKRLLRGALKNSLPPAIRERWNKQGFLPPHAEWFRDRLSGPVQDIIFSSEFAASPMWNTRWWKSALRRFEGGEAHLATVLWRPFIEDSWRKYFVERAKSAPKHAVFSA
ncbi:MAG: asparagine synthase (glutamine-hydrolyzing) [Rhodospirillales bacterium]|nr:asparagine synthase (glutamine-hydrolyzing) [Rhodospirillales bacterium]